MTASVNTNSAVDWTDSSYSNRFNASPLSPAAAATEALIT